MPNDTGHDWQAVKVVCVDCATRIFDWILGMEDDT